MTTYRKSRGSVQPYRVYRYALDDGGTVSASLEYIFDKNRNIAKFSGGGGSYHGTPAWKQDNVVGRYLKTATNNYVEWSSPAAHNFDATRSFSVSVWVKPDPTFGSFPGFINHIQSGAGIGWAIFCWSGGSPNNGTCYMRVADGTHVVESYSSSAKSCSADGKWHLVVGVCDRRSQVVKACIDLGPFFGETSISAVGSLVGDATSAMKIGQAPSIGGTDGFVGGVHDLRVHEDRVLSLVDITKLYREKMRVSSRPKRWMLSQHIAGGGGGGSVQNAAVSIIT